MAYALTPNTVGLIPTRGALSPEAGPFRSWSVRDPVLTHLAEGAAPFLKKIFAVKMAQARPGSGHTADYEGITTQSYMKCVLILKLSGNEVSYTA